MGLATFKGGVHPYEGKELSESKPIQVLMPKGELVFPLSQHIGAPCSPLVKVGDTVKLGQKIGDGEGVCSPVHASVSGTVAAVEQLPIPGGRQSCSFPPPRSRSARRTCRSYPTSPRRC